jgi:hypothetical protein
MEYAEQNGAAVREALSAAGDAVSTLAQAAADAGPGMLALVTAAARLVAALPPELVTILMQTAVALKLVSLAGAGIATAATAVQAFGARLAALQAASVAAGGGLAGVVAAFGALSTAAKATVVVAGIAAVGLALKELANIGQEAPPDIDKMTSSLAKLGHTGKLSGEAARVFGEDYEKLGESLATLARPSNMEKTQQFLTDLIGIDSTPVKNAKEDFNALDEALTNLVKGGKADIAKTALEHSIKNLKEQGFTADEVKGQLDSYKSALADVAFEQQLTAGAMGIFGQAALDTEAILSAQKRAADGLRASIIALNEVNRSAYEAQIGFEQALDDLTASFKEHGATLDEDTDAGRRNGLAMLAAARAQDELIASGLATNESLASMVQQSEVLRTTMMRLATEAFGGNKKAAEEYVNTLLGTPSEIKTLIKAEKEEAISGLKALQEEIDRTPDSTEVTVKTLNGAAIAALEAVGLKVERLPDGQVKVSAGGGALGTLGEIAAALRRLNGQTATTYVRTVRVGGVYGNKQIPVSASGGLLRRAGGGTVSEMQHFPDGGYIQGPGSGTSDSILATFASGAMSRVSNSEYVVRASSVAKYGVAFLDAVNQGRLKVAGYAKGGTVSQAEAQASSAARGALTISHFGQMAGYQRSEFRSALGKTDSLGELVN